jgi:hypothetical protein
MMKLPIIITQLLNTRTKSKEQTLYLHRHVLVNVLLYVSPENAILNRMAHNLMSEILQWGHTQPEI